MHEFIKKIQLKKLIIIFLLSGIIYVCMEVFFTAFTGELTSKVNFYSYISLIGYSSVWIFPIGGILGCVLGVLNEIPWFRRKKMILNALIGCLIITLIELLAGLFFNKLLGFNLWNYTILHILHQIDLFHTICWFALSPLIYWFNDYIRAEMYNKCIPYSLLLYYKQLITLK